jgi:argininosuccinate lyase
MSDRFIKGRLDMPADEFVQEFSASVGFDKRLAQFDIEGSIAHATMLAKVGVIAEGEKDQMIISPGR